MGTNAPNDLRSSSPRPSGTASDLAPEASPQLLPRICAAVAVLVFAYVVLLAWRSPATFPHAMTTHSRWPYLADKPTGEDGFYMFTVADYMATEGRIIYNRGLVATGIQPLATVVFAGIDWLVHRAGGTEWDLIRWVMVFGGALFVLLSYQIGRIAEALAPARWKPTAFALGCLLVLTDYTLFRLFTYGLETGIYLCAMAMCFASTERIVRRGRTSWAEAGVLGVAVGIAGLARIDFGLLFACVLVLMLLRRWIGIAQALASGLVALVIVSPWFWFLYRATGSWVPSSGKAESGLITLGTTWLRVKVMFLAVAAHVAPWSYGGMSVQTTVVTLLSLVALGWIVFSRRGRSAMTATPVGRQLLWLWAPGLVLLTVVYTVFFYSTHFYHRYMAPWAVLLVPLLAVILSDRLRTRRRLLTVVAGLVCLFGLWTIGALHTGHLGNPHTVTAGYIRQHYPTAHVGAFQSGVVGYFDRDVENLDGKLNLPAWRASQRHELPAFIDKEGIDVLVDWPSVITFFLPQSYIDAEWKPCPIPLTGTESVCLIRKTSKLRAVGQDASGAGGE